MAASEKVTVSALATLVSEETGALAVGALAVGGAAASAVAIAAQAGGWTVSEEGLVALADEVDLVDMVVLEAADQEAAATEVALEVGSVDQEVVDMTAEAADTAVVSVDAQGN